MSTVAIVSGVLEGLQLAANLAQASATVSAAVLQAQQTGKPVDWTSILGDEASAEANVLAAIAAAKAAGR
jgi:hypothetical protein